MSKYNCKSCYGAGASKHGRLCARCGGTGTVKETERKEVQLLRSLKKEVKHGS